MGGCNLPVVANTFFIAYQTLQVDDQDSGPLAYLADLADLITYQVSDICRGAKQPHQGPDQDDDGGDDPP